MAFSSRTMKRQQAATFIIRLLAFVVALLPILALLLPWVMMDGTRDILSGVGLVALLASPMREYLYQVDPLQAALLTVGPALIAILAIITGHSYYRRESIFWAPLLTLATAMAIVYIAVDLVSAIYGGLVAVIVVSSLLILHQALIRIQVTLRRKRKLRKIADILAVATGSGRYRWSDT